MAQHELRGRVRIGADAVEGAPVFLLDRDGDVLADVRSGAGGRFELPRLAGGTTVLAKFYTPVIGAAVAPLPAGSAADPELDLTLDGDRAVTLRAEIALPSDAPFDWVDVHVTPKSLLGVPDDALYALLRTGARPGKTSVYASQTMRERRFALRLMPGTYRLEIDRRVEHPSAPPGAFPPDLELGALAVVHPLPRGAAPPRPAAIGFIVDVTGDLEVEARLRAVEPEQS